MSFATGWHVIAFLPSTWVELEAAGQRADIMTKALGPTAHRALMVHLLAEGDSKGERP
jgi:hypothetical protein